MSNSVQLSNYTDFDRLLTGKNLFVTIVGSALAFTLSYMGITVDVPVIPYHLTFSIAVMIFVAIYTANIASGVLVVLIGALGLVGPDGAPLNFFLGYLVIHLIIVILLGYYSDKLQLVMNWTRFYLFMGVIFAVASVVSGILWNPYADRYQQASVSVGVGGNAGTGLDLPVLDLAVLGGLILLSLVILILLRGQIQLTRRESRKYTIFGYLFLLLGIAVTAVPLLLYSVKIGPQAMQMIARSPDHIHFLSELLFYGTTFGVYGEPVSIFLIIAVSTVLTSIGLSLKTIGEHHGNLEGKRGGADIAYYAAPLAFLVYFLYASYLVQNFIYPTGYFISIELFAVFAGAIWTLYFINQLIVRVVLMILRAK